MEAFRESSRRTNYKEKANGSKLMEISTLVTL